MQEPIKLLLLQLELFVNDGQNQQENNLNTNKQNQANDKFHITKDKVVVMMLDNLLFSYHNQQLTIPEKELFTDQLLKISSYLLKNTNLQIVNILEKCLEIAEKIISVANSNLRKEKLIKLNELKNKYLKLKKQQLKKVLPQEQSNSVIFYYQDNKNYLALSKHIKKCRKNYLLSTNESEKNKWLNGIHKYKTRFVYNALIERLPYYLRHLKTHCNDSKVIDEAYLGWLNLSYWLFLQGDYVAASTVISILQNTVQVTGTANNAFLETTQCWLAWHTKLYQVWALLLQKFNGTNNCNDSKVIAEIFFQNNEKAKWQEYEEKLLSYKKEYYDALQKLPQIFEQQTPEEATVNIEKFKILQQKFSQQIITMLQIMLHDAVALIGYPLLGKSSINEEDKAELVDYCLVGVGTLARCEITPNTPLNFMLLSDRKIEKHHGMRLLHQLFSLECQCIGDHLLLLFDTEEEITNNHIHENLTILDFQQPTYLCGNDQQKIFNIYQQRWRGQFGTSFSGIENIKKVKKNGIKTLIQLQKLYQQCAPLIKKWESILTIEKKDVEEKNNEKKNKISSTSSELQLIHELIVGVIMALSCAHGKHIKNFDDGLKFLVINNIIDPTLAKYFEHSYYNLLRLQLKIELDKEQQNNETTQLNILHLWYFVIQPLYTAIEKYLPKLQDTIIKQPKINKDLDSEQKIVDKEKERKETMKKQVLQLPIEMIAVTIWQTIFINLQNSPCSMEKTKISNVHPAIRDIILDNAIKNKEKNSDLFSQKKTNIQNNTIDSTKINTESVSLLDDNIENICLAKNTETVKKLLLPLPYYQRLIIFNKIFTKQSLKIPAFTSKELIKNLIGGNYTELNFSSTNTLEENELLDVLKKSDLLQELNISGCKKLSYNVFIKLAIYAPKIKKIIADDCNFQTIGSESYPVNFPELCELSLNNNQNLLSVFFSAPELRSIKANNCTKLQIIATQAKNLNHLCINNCPQLTITNLVKTSLTMKYLTTLEIENSIKDFPWLNKYPLLSGFDWSQVPNEYIKNVITVCEKVGTNKLFSSRNITCRSETLFFLLNEKLEQLQKNRRKIWQELKTAMEDCSSDSLDLIHREKAIERKVTSVNLLLQLDYPLAFHPSFSNLINSLISAMSDKEDCIREKVVWGLRNLYLNKIDPEIIDKLILQQLKNTMKNYLLDFLDQATAIKRRVASADLLLQFNRSLAMNSSYSDLIGFLVKIMQNNDENLKKIATESLEKIDLNQVDQKVIVTVTNALINTFINETGYTKESTRIRESVVVVLGKLDLSKIDPKVLNKLIDKLIGVLQNDYSSVRRKIANLLKNLPLANINPNVIENIVNALVTALLNDKDELVRKGVAEVLEKLDLSKVGLEVIDKLIKALEITVSLQYESEVIKKSAKKTLENAQLNEIDKKLNFLGELAGKTEKIEELLGISDTYGESLYSIKFYSKKNFPKHNASKHNASKHNASKHNLSNLNPDKPNIEDAFPQLSKELNFLEEAEKKIEEIKKTEKLKEKIIYESPVLNKKPVNSMKIIGTLQEESLEKVISEVVEKKEEDINALLNVSQNKKDYVTKKTIVEALQCILDIRNILKEWQEIAEEKNLKEKIIFDKKIDLNEKIELNEKPQVTNKPIDKLIDESNKNNGKNKEEKITTKSPPPSQFPISINKPTHKPKSLRANISDNIYLLLPSTQCQNIKFPANIIPPSLSLSSKQSSQNKSSLFPSVTSTFLPSTNINANQWVVTLAHAPHGSPRKHAFIVVEGINSSGNGVIKRYDFFENLNSTKKGFGKVQILPNPENDGKKDEYDDLINQPFPASAICKKLHSSIFFFEDNKIDYKAFVISAEQGEKLHQMILMDLGKDIPYQKQVKSLLFFTNTSKIPTYDDYLWAREKLMNLGCNEINQTLKPTLIDKITDWTTYDINYNHTDNRHSFNFADEEQITTLDSSCILM